mmetsp:Transcript_3149/g.8940  ORF Transcript_3149/g.8940 Transcript_3149/m.8940 type:complete len:268 (+) Transcript_3149:19-822(+)
MPPGHMMLRARSSRRAIVWADEMSCSFWAMNRSTVPPATSDSICFTTTVTCRQMKPWVWSSKTASTRRYSGRLMPMESSSRLKSWLWYVPAAAVSVGALLRLCGMETGRVSVEGCWLVAGAGSSVDEAAAAPRFLSALGNCGLVASGDSTPSELLRGRAAAPSLFVAVSGCLMAALISDWRGLPGTELEALPGSLTGTEAVGDSCPAAVGEAAGVSEIGRGSSTDWELPRSLGAGREPARWVPPGWPLPPLPTWTGKARQDQLAAWV